MLIKPSPTLESALGPGKALGPKTNLWEYSLRFKNWLVQNRYSPNTIKTYTSALKVFLNHYSNRLPESLNDKDVEEFMLCSIINAGLSHAYQNQMVNAISLFFKAIVKSEINPTTIERPRREYLLPKDLSKSEVKKILESVRNQKHRCMLSLIYACGLRRGELLNLKPEYVDSKRNLLKIRLAKGDRDRMVPLTPKIHYKRILNIDKTQLVSTNKYNDKMNLKINDRIIEFKIIPLSFNEKNIESVFYEKNNKTLKQTFEHPKYSRLKLLLLDKYNAQLDKNLGDFLKLLKQGNDSNYLCFLNKYGDSRYCNFKIDTHLKDKGIYCYIKDDKIKYVGRCTNNFKKRINQGYGKIHPKNCFIDGQATNCHLNSIINSADNVKFGVYIMNDKQTHEIIELEKQILTCNRFEWNIQTS